MIIEDESDIIFKAVERTDVKNVLVLTGGGLAQTFFALGASGCLYDNGMLEHHSFDVISVVSGGSLLGSLLELCYLYKFDLDTTTDNWFHKYVREGGIYAAVESKIIAKCISYGGDIAKSERVLFDKYVPLYKLDAIDFELRGPIFEYNVIEMNSNELSTKHADILDYANVDKRDPYWYAIRPARCCLPISNFKGRPLADAGAISNTPVTTLYEKYNITNRLIIIKCFSKFRYDEYPTRSFTELMNDYLWTLIYTSRDSTALLLDRFNTPEVNKTSFMVTSSNSLNQSKDPFHKGMIKNHNAEINGVFGNYVGLLFQSDEYIRILENEGYIQTYHKLKEKGLLKCDFRFRIPNPQYYKEDVKSKWDALKSKTTQSALFDYLNTVFETFVETMQE